MGVVSNTATVTLEVLNPYEGGGGDDLGDEPPVSDPAAGHQPPASASDARTGTAGRLADTGGSPAPWVAISLAGVAGGLGLALVRRRGIRRRS